MATVLLRSEEAFLDMGSVILMNMGRNLFPGLTAVQLERTCFVLALAGLLWLASHPYQGIYHDSVIYSILAARHLHPEGFGRELFFMFGSQDDFSLYTPFHVSLINFLGFDLANRVIVILGGVFWVLSFFWIGKVLFRNDLRWMALVLLAAVVTWSYSPNGSIFRLNENFATARVISLPLGLMALAAVMTGKRWLAIVLALASCLLHPLLGIWPLILIVCYRWPWRLLVVLAALTILALVVIPMVFPFWSLKLMDPEWADIIRFSTTDVFLEEPVRSSPGRALLCLLALALGCRHGEARLRPLYRTLALMTASGYLLSYVCSQYWPVTLVIQAQPWRVLWLAICGSLLAAADALWVIFRRSPPILIFYTWVALIYYALPDFSSGVAAGAALLLLNDSGFMIVSRASAWLGRHKFLLAAMFMGMAIILLPRYLLDLEMAGVEILPVWWMTMPIFGGFFLGGGIGLGILFWVWIAANDRLRRLAWFIVLPLLVLAMYGWDHRSGEFLAAEQAYLSREVSVPDFHGVIQPGDVVLWPGNELRVWLELKTAVYAGAYQNIGIVFSEEKAKEAKRRLYRIAAAEIIGEEPGLSEAKALARFQKKLVSGGLNPNNIHNYERTVIRTAALPYLCADSELDWVVLGAGPENGGKTGRKDGQVLHSCRRFRERMHERGECIQSFP